MGIEDNQNVRVSISYARADAEVANRLYNDLKLTGLNPWLDTQSLLGGQNWRIAISLGPPPTGMSFILVYYLQILQKQYQT